MRFWIYGIAISLMIFPSAVRAAMEDYPSVKLQGLDKSTARTTTFEAKVGSTITYGRLFIRIQACRKAPPIETPESAAFLQIWEVPPETGKSEWLFSGWMFASSPALSGMDHPVYDVWVLDCLGREEPNEEAKKSETDVDVESQDELVAPTVDGQPAATPEVTPEAAPAPASDTPVDVIDSEADMSPDTDATGTMPQEEDVGSQTPSVDPETTMPTTPAPTNQPPVDYDAPYSPQHGYPAQIQ